MSKMCCYYVITLEEERTGRGLSNGRNLETTLANCRRAWYRGATLIGAIFASNWLLLVFLGLVILQGILHSKVNVKPRPAPAPPFSLNTTPLSPQPCLSNPPSS